QGIAFVDGHVVGDTIPRVKHDPCGTSRGIEGQNSLNGYIHGWHIECLKHNLKCKALVGAYLGHFLTVGFGIQRCLSQQSWVLFRCNPQLIIERMLKYLLHVVPVCNDAMLYGVFQGQDSSLALSLVTHIAVFLTHTNHHTL
ncbi:hypothetical protein Nmel_010441, partial [Mimus melanotis]